MDFGNVLVSKSVSKEIILKNSSEVAADFRIERRDNGEYEDQFFTFEPIKTTLPPKASFSLKITYSPSFVDCKTINNFSLVCENGNKVPLSLKGYSRRFNVAFNSSSINFG